MAYALGTEQIELQWGRRMFAAETNRRGIEVGACEWLQWGRRMFAAETAPLYLLVAHPALASMGPPHVRGGDHASTVVQPLTRNWWLQWGRRMFAAETCPLP